MYVLITLKKNEKKNGTEEIASVIPTPGEDEFTNIVHMRVDQE